MYRHAPLIAAALLATLAFAEEDVVVFKSDVALVRVDAQVVDKSNRAITGLQAGDFVVYESGQKQEIRNFASEEMPLDVVLLLDVSGSMRPHVERVASAAHSALQVLGERDRVAIMVFDRASRIRMPLRNGASHVERELEYLLQQETFDGGTDITRALLDAATYIGREGRKNARRAVIILTDDQTERGRDETRVLKAFSSANAVLMAMIAPDAMDAYSRGGGYPSGGRYPRSGGGGYPGGGYPGGGYPGGGYPGGGGLGGPLGGIILGRRGPLGGGYPGGGYPGGGYPRGGGNGPIILGRGGHTASAGTEEIARRSGGDSNRVDDSYALQDLLERLRQRYALYFYLPPNAKEGQERNIEVALADGARQRYRDAEVRYRQNYLAPGAGGSDETNVQPVVVSQTPSATTPPDQSRDDSSGLKRRRRPAVDDTGGSRGPSVGGWPAAGPDDSSRSIPSARQPEVSSGPQSQSQEQKGGWRRSTDGDRTVDSQVPAPPPPSNSSGTVKRDSQPAPAPEPAEQKGGWRRVKPGEQP